MSFITKLIESIGSFFKKLFESTQDAFNDLPKEQQESILQGVQVSQIIKDNVSKGETEVIALIASKLGISEDIATGLFAQLSADLKVDQVVTGVADKIQQGLTDLAHNALFENIAKFAASFFGVGKVNWVTLGLGVVEYAYQELKSSDKLVTTNGNTTCPAGQYWDSTTKSCQPNLG